MNNTAGGTLQQEKTQSNQSDRSKQVVIQAVAMALGTFTSRLMGLARESLFLALFPRTVTDAWYIAFRLPNIFRRLFGEGSLSVSFIPVFVEAKVQGEGTPRARDLVNGFYTLFFILLSVLTAIGVLFPEFFLNIFLDESYRSVAGKFELTVSMARIMFLYIFLVCTYAYFMGILNAMGKFGLAAMAPTFFNISMVISTLIPKRFLNWDGQGIAWGVVVGGLVQAGVLIPPLKKMGYWPKLTLHFNHPDVWRVLRNMVPGLLGMGVLQIGTIINMRFASELGEGPISFINLADRLLELPLALVSVSIGSALLPTLSRMWTETKRGEMAATSNYYMRLNLFVCVPAAVGLFCLSYPIVELLFQHGRFKAEEAMITAGVVQVYAFLIVSTSLVRVFVPNYYAIKNTWFPALTSGLCLGVHLVMAPILMHRFGLYGLNSSAVLSSTLNFLILAGFYRLFIGRFGWGNVFWSVLKFGGIGAVMAGSLQIYHPLREFAGNSMLAKIFCLGTSGTLAVLVYGGLSSFFKVEEFHSVFKTLLAKIKKKTTKAS